MVFAPDMNELLARARADLRMGLPIVLKSDAAYVALAIETLSEARLAALQAMSTQAVVAITDRRARTLKAHAYDGDLARITLPVDARLAWVLGVADPADDLKTPMKGPLNAHRNGDATAHRAALHLIKSARLLPAAVLAPVPDHFAASNNLTDLPVQSIIPAIHTETDLNSVISARLPLSVSDDGRLHVFRPADGGEEHYAVEIGRPDRSLPVLARLHSACFTGDLLGSLKCDCGPQLRGALAQMGEERAGVLLYLNQEGRGIGLANKLRAYSLQDQGFDTVEANHRLGFEDDERDFRFGANILRRMGFNAVRLMTNNPAKIAMMQSCGLTVTERVPLKVGENAHNSGYLATKAKKSGHLL